MLCALLPEVKAKSFEVLQLSQAGAFARGKVRQAMWYNFSSGVRLLQVMFVALGNHNKLQNGVVTQRGRTVFRRSTPVNMSKSRRGKSASANELSRWETELIQAPFNEVSAILTANINAATSNKPNCSLTLNFEKCRRM